MHRKVKERLDSVRASARARNATGCPERQVWVQVAIESLASSELERLKMHARGCEQCRPLLEQAVADLYRVPTAEQMSDLEGELASPPWLADLPERMAAKSGEQRIPFLVRHKKPVRWAALAAAVLAACGLGLWWKAHNGPEEAERLLASAYTQDRSLELRVAGASYGDLKIRRGNGGSHFDRPKALLDADALIADQRALHPQDATWLRLEGRADLLVWDYDGAIQVLKRAQELKPDAPEILVDLASAYFERAEVTGRGSDYGAANELLSQALGQRADDPVALYNRAIVGSHILLYAQADSDLKRLLAIEPKDGWANQAQLQLAELEKKKRGN